MAERRRRTLLITRRKACSLSQAKMASLLDIDERTYRRYELGEIPVPHAIRPRLAVVLDGWSLAELHAAVDDAGAGHQVLPEFLTLYASLEQGAARLWSWQPYTVHALLQTPAYAEAVERTAIDASENAVAQRVTLRLSRQAALRRLTAPSLELAVVLDESVLYRVTGGQDVMAEQLVHLDHMAAAPNIDLRLLPLAAPCHAAAWGAFTLLASSGQRPHVGMVVDRTGFRYLEGAGPVDLHVELFEHLTAAALGTEASVDLIRHTIKERYHR